MAAPIPTSVPVSFFLGDTWTWTKDLADYPASTWTLTYYFVPLAGGDDRFDVVATADGTTHSVTVAAATTAAYVAGKYQWIGRVTDGTTTTTIGEGVAELIDNPASGTNDGRSFARKMLDLCEVTYQALVAKKVESASVNGQSYNLTNRAELLTELRYWQAKVADEDAAQSIAQGMGNPKRVLVRFN